jgi:hypothetical protein
MPRFYFHLACKNDHVHDDDGKEFDSLNDAAEHARKLIDKILFHVGYDDAEAWKVIISNDQDHAQMIVPFLVSHGFQASADALQAELTSYGR